MKIMIELSPSQLLTLEWWMKKERLSLTKWQTGKGFVSITSPEMAREAIREWVRRLDDLYCAEQIAAESYEEVRQDHHP